MSSLNGSSAMAAPPPAPSPAILPNLPLISKLSSVNSTGDAPVRKIFTENDIAPWLESATCHYIETFMLRLTLAVEGKKVDDPCESSQAIVKITTYLQRLSKLVDETPLDTGPQRFGNKAFRDWNATMLKSEPDFQRTIVTDAQAAVLPELSYHFTVSFGSPQRLDYGTGHELSFLSYLLILRLIGVFGERDEQAIVTRVFVAYLEVVRRLQKRFRLEPAGSKGVWGLDDHQHLVYLFGASQLRTHPTLRPSSILTPASISPHGVSYLFLSSILHVNDLKTGRFSEHSPMLHNIGSTVPNWGKVNTGLTKMYREEVLKKVPVIQHFRFGGVLSWTHFQTGEQLPSTSDHTTVEDLALSQRDSTNLDNFRIRDEGTVAPWALPRLSGVTPPLRSSTNTPPSSEMGQPQTRTPTRQTGSSTISPAPLSFVPPTLFPQVIGGPSRRDRSHGS